MAEPVILCNGGGPLYPASYCGDEPYLFAENLPESLVIVGRDRKRSAIMAANAGVRVLILDDGMQLRQLQRDYEMTILDASDPFGLGYFLPRGFLRESAKSLKRAPPNYHQPCERKETYLQLKEKIKSYSQAPTVGMRPKLDQIHDLRGEKVTIQGTKVAAFLRNRQASALYRSFREGRLYCCCHSCYSRSPAAERDRADCIWKKRPRAWSRLFNLHRKR